MHHRRFRIWPALIGLGILLALGTVAPVAVGASDINVSFGTGAGNQRVLILSGHGFAPGEQITLTGLVSDGSTVNFPAATGNGIGGFDATIPFNPGVFRIRAVGQLTGITSFVDVGDIAGVPPGFLGRYPALGPCALGGGGYFYNSCAFGYGPFFPGYAGLYGPAYVYAPGTTAVQPPATTPATGTATVGTPVTVTAGGFTPNESVSAWVTGPDGNVTQIGSAPAAADGTVTISVTFPSAGNWQVTAHGQSSQKDVVSRYTVS